MRSTAMALKDEYDEAPVSSTEVLETNVVTMRDELKELKMEFKDHRKEFQATVSRVDLDIKSAVARLENDIKSAVSELRAEIREMAAKAERELEKLAARVEQQFAEIRGDQKVTREKVDTMDRKLDHLATKVSLLLWLVGGAITLTPVIITVGKALKWF